MAKERDQENLRNYFINKKLLMVEEVLLDAIPVMEDRDQFIDKCLDTYRNKLEEDFQEFEKMYTNGEDKTEG